MLKHKRIRDKGKISFSEYFKKLKEGDRVALVQKLGVRSNFPKKMQGKTGEVIEKRGSAYVVQVNDLNLAKKFIVKPIHLKKLNYIEK